MCEIINELFQKNFIKSESRNSFLNEKEPEKRLKLFEKLILASGENGFEEFIRLLRNSEMYCKLFRFPHGFSL